MLGLVWTGEDNLARQMRELWKDRIGGRMDRTAEDPQKLADLNMNRGKMDRASKHVHARAGKKGNPILPSYISHLCGAEIACFLFPPFLPPRPPCPFEQSSSFITPMPFLVSIALLGPAALQSGTFLAYCCGLDQVRTRDCQTLKRPTMQARRPRQALMR